MRPSKYMKQSLEKAIFKFNNGRLAMLCSGCSTIIKVGYQMNEDELKAAQGKKFMSAQYCENCKKK